MTLRPSAGDAAQRDRARHHAPYPSCAILLDNHSPTASAQPEVLMVFRYRIGSIRLESLVLAHGYPLPSRVLAAERSVSPCIPLVPVSIRTASVRWHVGNGKTLVIKESTFHLSLLRTTRASGI